MGLVTLPVTLVAHASARAADVMADLNEILAELNGNVDHENLAAAVGGEASRLVGSGNALGSICVVNFTATGRPVLVSLVSSGTSTGVSDLQPRRNAVGIGPASWARISSTDADGGGSLVVFDTAPGAVAFDVLISGGALLADTYFSVVEL